MDEEPRGSKCELKIWQEKSKKDGERETVSVPTLGGVSAMDSQYAVVVRQIFTNRNALEKTRLTINSPALLEVFAKVIKSYPTLAADFTEPFDMESPFQMLYHFWDDLLAFKDSADASDDQRMHLNLLFEFMDADMGAEKRAMEKSIQSGHVGYDVLWMIFKPGELVVTSTMEETFLMQVTKTAYEENPNLGRFLEVHCVFTDFDGTDVGEVKEFIRLPQKQYFGQGNPSKIVELPVYPRRFHAEGEALEKRLVERGHHFLSLQGIFTKQADGIAEYLREPPPSYWEPDMDLFPLVWMPYQENGRVIIDRKTFQQDNYRKPVSPYHKITDHERLLCPPYVPGFSVTRQEWCRFYLCSLSEVVWNTAAFDSLILPELQLRMVRALTTSHTFPASDRDQSEQKGKGLVILLHGPPGSGKTLTAECAAEATKRALFVTSLQTLNKHESSYHFERDLRKILRLATVWKAVVLFDEADVFLEARSDDSPGSGSTPRNALVAIFLRHLEYFSGIVFLTTNRIGVFDAAMKSRLHLALGYSSPGPESRRLIWDQCLTAIPPEEIDLDREAALEVLSKERVNGREISNIVNTARTLARFEEEPLKKSHVDAVLGVWQDFAIGLSKMRSLTGTMNAGKSLDRPRVRQSSILMTEEPEDFAQNGWM